MALNQSALEWEDRRSSDSRLPPPPVLTNSVPAEITNQQATDPSWRPPDVGNTQKERVESEFVDLLRSHRTHSQEAGSVGQRVALAFVVACANEHFTLEAHLHRLHGVIFDASPSADEIIQALGCTSRQKAVQRHFPQQMLLPQVAFQMKLEAYVADGHDAQHKGGYFEALAGGDWLSILGWRAAMMRRLHITRAKLVDTLSTLESVLPPGSSRCIEDYRPTPLKPLKPPAAVPPPPTDGPPVAVPKGASLINRQFGIGADTEAFGSNSGSNSGSDSDSNSNSDRSEYHSAVDALSSDSSDPEGGAAAN